MYYVYEEVLVRDNHLILIGVKLFLITHCTGKDFYIPTRRVWAIYGSHLVRSSVSLFILSLQITLVLLEEIIWYMVYSFGIVNCTVSPHSRCRTQVLYWFLRLGLRKTFVTDFSISTGTNGLLFNIQLWHRDLYHVSPLQISCPSTSCLTIHLEIFLVDLCIYLTEWVRVFLAWCSVQHFVLLYYTDFVYFVNF